MTFITDTDITRYEDFVRNHPTKSHFMQSAAWGELNKEARGMDYRLVSLENDSGDICAAALLLIKKPPVFPAYIYCPRGFVLDYHDSSLLREFTEHVVAFGRSIGAMYIKIDPDIELREILRDGSSDPDGPDGTYARNNILACGFVPNGDRKVFGGRQPRFTFRIDLTGTESEIRKRVTGNVMKNIRKGNEYYPCSIRIGDEKDIPDLHRLVTLTGERDDFVGYSLQYYEDLYRVLARHNMVKLYVGTAYPSEIRDSLIKRKTDIEKALLTYKKEAKINEAHIMLERLENEIALFSGYAEKYPDGEVISVHFVVKYGKHEWAVHAGSAGVMNETFLNNRVYWQKIMDAKADGAEWIDQFGTVGDPDNSPLRSLHEFKRQFGGRYMEFIGEFDYILKPFWYKLYYEMLPKVRSFRITVKQAFHR
ncbi:MAG: peptidoglycan bridge formation glycyltransferase FemA/FemB family protein [Lachnospiraceae bacterium]|nr:peptidoglycan bridge formation glycyltransferase FemA/FemB family protein [Oscillospiraceae bacterium]MBR3339613.1 peptidoglycan bridge formation glycyltransferase FemA/FemB family protein [Lachnospiraceae bacterium]